MNSYIEQFKNPDGDGYIIDECEHESAESLILTGIFHFCGCGFPEKCLIFLRDMLSLINTYTNGDLTEYLKNEIKTAGTLGAACFMYYLLDQKGFTEHGGAVPGWLSDNGEGLLNDLNSLELEKESE